MSRTIPAHLAEIIEKLELERPELVTTEEIGELIDKFDVKTQKNRVIQLLSEKGWLLKTDVQGVWEFSPAERAGPFSTESPFLPLKAMLKRDPDRNIRVALDSAMWCHDFLARLPSEIEVALPPEDHVPAAIKRNYRVLRFEAHLEPVTANEIPVQRLETILVHLVDKPNYVQSWTSVFDWLPDLVEEMNKENVLTELINRSHSTKIRFAYLLSGLASDLVKDLNIEPAGKVWFGPRQKIRRHNAKWNVADTILPADPKKLDPVRKKDM
ncbi:MAG: type IV toxin-antitoxin system AbiEi family antitoxin [bacterium]